MLGSQPTRQIKAIAIRQINVQQDQIDGRLGKGVPLRNFGRLYEFVAHRGDETPQVSLRNGAIFDR